MNTNKKDLQITKENEVKIITSLFSELKEQNFTISVYDGELLHENQSLSNVLGFHKKLNSMLLEVRYEEIKGYFSFVFNNDHYGIFCLFDYNNIMSGFIEKTSSLINDLSRQLNI